MIYIILIAIFKGFIDSLKSDQFDNSIFKNLKGTWWDIRVRETKYHNMNPFLYMILIHFLDAWHFFNSCMLLTFMIGLYYFEPTAYNLFVHIAMMFVLYGIFFEGTRYILMGKNYKYR